VVDLYLKKEMGHPRREWEGNGTSRRKWKKGNGTSKRKNEQIRDRHI